MSSQVRRKVLRLLQIQRLLVRQPAGYTTRELADRLGVHPRTVLRDLLDLQSDPLYVPLDGGQRRPWRISEEGRFSLPPLTLSLQEGAALYLAARLLQIVCDEPNHHVTRALRVLAQSLPPEVGEPILRMVSRQEEVEDAFAFSRIFGVLALGWGTGRKVAVTYHSFRSDRVQECRFSPYAFEPSPWGFGIYVLGVAEPPGELRTFKVERVLEAELTGETFDPPAGFDPGQYLAGAWGIWRGEEPVEVRLRFSPAVARRVRETRWHPSQVIEGLPGGGCLLTAQVSEPLEMLPWIRGWGADCEVLAPADLRERLVEEIGRLGGVYRAGEGS